MRVRVSPPAPIERDKAEKLAYLVGVALGDGNLSCPNGRATRLRVTCDERYPKLAREIETTISALLPKNKVSRVLRADARCFDISVYSNKLNGWMPWQVDNGSKAQQKARLPLWIKENTHYAKACMRGLIQTDGCIYVDRGYQMVNFTNNCKELAEDARDLMTQIGFRPSFMAVKVPTGVKYTARVARDAKRFIKELRLYKA